MLSRGGWSMPWQWNIHSPVLIHQPVLAAEHRHLCRYGSTVCLALDVKAAAMGTWYKRLKDMRVPSPGLGRYSGNGIALMTGGQRGTENWRILKFIGTLRLLMCWNEGGVAQKNLMAAVSEWTFLSSRARDKLAMTGFAGEGIFEGIGNWMVWKARKNQALSHLIDNRVELFRSSSVEFSPMSQSVRLSESH